MPRSKSKRRRYTPPPRKKHRPSPKWYGALILFTFAAGVLLIVLNYLGLVPGGTKSLYLFVGLGAIALGFVLATRWH
jgi:Cell division protein CrgA